MLIATGFVLFILRETFAIFTRGEITSEISSLMALALMLAAVANILMGYLSGHFDKEDSSPLGELREAQRELQHLRAIRNDAEHSLSQLKHLSASGFTPTEEEREEILSAAQKSFQEQMEDEVLEKFVNRYAANVLATQQQEALRERYMECRDRLQQEVSALSRRGNVNLTLGFLATSLALGVLAWISFQLPSPDDVLDWGDLVTRYVPRVALAVFIQVFAFFFLRLYKATLQETKYFQNEITNLDMYGISLEAATHIADDNLTKELCTILAKIDRNFLGTVAPSAVGTKVEDKTNEQLIGLAKEIVTKLAK